MKISKISLIVVLLLNTIFILQSCSIKPIVSEVNYVNLPNYEVDLGKLGNGRIMIYNGHYYCPIITCGTTTKVNVLLNNKSLGQINYGEYFIVDVGIGVYNFHLEHKEFIKFKSDHEIKIDENTKVLKLVPTNFSNKLIITNKLPEALPYFKQLFN